MAPVAAQSASHRRGVGGESQARYANRVAISNSRLIAVEGEEVLFRYKDYRDSGQWKILAMPGVEFIRRFLLHVLPRGMRHIRRFGFMGPSVHWRKLTQIRALLGVADRKPALGSLLESDPWDGDSDLEEERDNAALIFPLLVFGENPRRTNQI